MTYTVSILTRDHDLVVATIAECQIEAVIDVFETSDADIREVRFVSDSQLTADQLAAISAADPAAMISHSPVAEEV